MTIPRAASQDLTLFNWPELREIDRLEGECRSLATRIAALRPHSHYRLELEVRLRALRARQLDIECRIGRR